ncbi:nucleoside triphosphate pyrophosphohydrolase [Lactobacillus jensenii]|jgi:phosphoribosyl-ATP diphosphatase|uniref:Nucleoside triphosphate pyrophosphohydrolase n=2 Tax=Lactobacillus TaxID=1578 RepID=A0A5N1IFS9_LACJE|nr:MULTISPECIES: nucleoside triphosphate pyrophosphohydrolase [Lactobacillus]EEQ68696.1 putative phosphoribosyl-ATP diphosphatase [Lactobacillus jensenii 1153]ERJ44969.1 phosphoribosyl-ATP pyrophosphohydrolase [Lactobacillus jensenii MD IIE-70(2)]APT14406.1 phosphoribosyl-ATP pyrophosphohydrolase [Lactobacillus jensenii]EEQ25042.1 putative phosphoribosyl-ATP diphosphatase [Lactobacillus jensenii 269-3]EEX28086.1 putative phosphoribosyl-ATP diphosphatase [Lactobacillus jensenii SJ-7A-US]
MNKLVRDKIPEFVTNAKFRKLNQDEILPALKNKIVEEANEVKDATSEENLIEELADVYTVLKAFLDFKGITEEELLKVVNDKKAFKGDFSKFLFMEKS